MSIDNQLVLILKDSNNSKRKFISYNLYLKIKKSNFKQSDKYFLYENWSESHAQNLQDLLILILTNRKKKGFFVEFGACDGVEFSNTFLLESQYKWNGILSEPLDDWHQQLSKNRIAKIEKKALWSHSGEKLVIAKGKSKGLTSVKRLNKYELFNLWQRQKVDSISLNDLLLVHKAPKIIDFVSVDTEGTEYEILKEFNFKNWQVNFFCIEHNYSENRSKIRDLMFKQGYELILSEFSGIDDWFKFNN